MQSRAVTGLSATHVGAHGKSENSYSRSERRDNKSKVRCLKEEITKVVSLMASEKPCNILLVVLDTARARNITPYGYERDTTPNLSRLADDGIVYENTVSPSPWSLPSHASLFTGRYPSAHGAHEQHTYFDGNCETLAEYLSKRGYDTLGISSNSWVGPEFGMNAGFEKFIPAWKLFDTTIGSNRVSDFSLLDRFVHYLRQGELLTSVANIAYRKFYYREYDYGATRTNYEIKQRICDLEDPFFVFLNYFEPHLEYGPPKFTERYVDAEPESVNQNAWKYTFGVESMADEDFEVLEALYDAELRYVDHMFGKVIDHLKKNDLYEDMMVVVTSDHGENIGDHGFMDHQYCLYNTLLHVPLIVKYPNGIEIDGDKNESMTSLLDVFPTIQYLLGDTNGEQLDGCPLPPLVDPSGDRYLMSEYLAPYPSPESVSENYPEADRALLEKYDRSITAIQSRNEKYIHYGDGSTEFFRLSNGLDEREGNTEELTEEVKRQFESKIEKLKGNRDESSGSDTPEPSESIKRNLEDLGYLR
jgi:arylsulfatase A-like enzyme